MNLMEQAYNNHQDKQEAKLRANVERQLDKAELKNQAARKVVVADIDMPFMSMVWFMVKWSLAAIPAVIILALAGVVASALFAGLLG